MVLFVLATDSLLCDMLVTFGSFVCYIKSINKNKINK